MKQYKCVRVLETDWAGTGALYGDVVCVPAECDEIGTTSGDWKVLLVEAENAKEAANMALKMCEWGCPVEKIVQRA